MEPNWQGGRLLPTGGLTVIKCEPFCNDTILGAYVEAVDEVGVIWNVSNRKFLFEAQPLRYPKVFRCQWVLGYGSNHGQSEYQSRYVADSFDEAVTLAIANQKWKDKRDQYKLLFTLPENIVKHVINHHLLRSKQCPSQVTRINFGSLKELRT